MGRGKIYTAAVLLVLVAVLVGPAPVAAKPGYFKIDPSNSMEVQLRGSRGFRIFLSASGSQVSLAAWGHDALVEYTASGTAEKGRIKARFADLGRVALRFHPRGKAHLLKEPEGNCSGGSARVQPGVFVGRFDFEGEQGYTSIHSSRVRGTVTHTKRQICKEGARGEGSPSDLKGTILSAEADENKISFSASQIEFKSKSGFSGTAFGATIVEFPQPGLSVFRSIQASGDPTAFSIVSSHHHVDEATVVPPAPFSGSATYQRAVSSQSESWVGSLAGDFPGLGTVSLAGPDFCAQGTLLKDCHGPNAWLVAVAS